MTALLAGLWRKLAGQSSFKPVDQTDVVRGRQMPELVPVSPPCNDCRHLPLPSQFESVALATIHPKLASAEAAITSLDWQSPYSLPTHRVANEPLPFGLGVPHRTLQLPTSFRPRNRDTLSRPLPTCPVFHEVPLSRHPLITPRSTYRFLLALFHRDV